jgi:EpsI family protein
LGCLIIFLVGTRLQGGPLAKSSARDASESRPREWANRRVFALGCLAISAMTLTTMVFKNTAAPDRSQQLLQPLASFPIEISGYQGSDIPISRKALDNLGTDLAVMRDYRKAGVTVPINFYVIFYPSQQEHTSMHSPLHCIPGAGWETDKSTVMPLNSKTFGRPFNINRVLFRNGEDRELVLYWYMEQGRPEHSEIGGALKTLWSGVVNRRTDGCLIRVAAPVVGSEEETFRQELKFLDIALPVLLQEFLPSAEKPGVAT